MIGIEEEKRITKEEMNLAEYPLQYLGFKVPDDRKTIEWHGEVITKDRIKKEASWIITGSDKYGLPRYKDRDVLLGLLYYWKLQGFQSNELVISNVHEFLKFLKWDTSQKGYNQLDESLSRLAGVTIIAKHSFWDNNRKDYADSLTFHILDSAKLNKIGGRYILEVRAGNEFWESIKSGYIKSLNFDFYLSLETPLAKALYSYLDKKSYQKEEFEIELVKLATHLGITSQKIWHIRDRIREASEILLRRGFLSSYYFKKKRNLEFVIYRFNKGYTSERTQEEVARSEAYVEYIKQEIQRIVGKGNPEYLEKVARSIPSDLIFRILGEIREQAENGTLNTSRFELFKKLVRKYSREMLKLPWEK